MLLCAQLGRARRGRARQEKQREARSSRRSPTPPSVGERRHGRGGGALERPLQCIYTSAAGPPRPSPLVLILPVSWNVLRRLDQTAQMWGGDPHFARAKYRRRASTAALGAFALPQEHYNEMREQSKLQTHTWECVHRPRSLACLRVRCRRARHRRPAPPLVRVGASSPWWIPRMPFVLLGLSRFSDEVNVL